MTRRIIWIILGALAIAAGAVALANPLAATLTAERIAGWTFLFIGIVQIFAVFQQTGWGGRIWVMVVGAALTLLGIMLLARPLEGVLSLTLVVGVLFLVAGVLKVILSFSLGRGRAFWMVLLSGVVSIVLAVMILANFPQSAATILGLLLAIELISNGVSMIALSGSVAATGGKAAAAG
jgi:uncharacterized membrane protein HdeD (DUF308 family)